MVAFNNVGHLVREQRARHSFFSIAYGRSEKHSHYRLPARFKTTHKSPFLPVSVSESLRTLPDGETIPMSDQSSSLYHCTFPSIISLYRLPTCRHQEPVPDYQPYEIPVGDYFSRPNLLTGLGICRPDLGTVQTILFSPAMVFCGKPSRGCAECRSKKKRVS